MRGLLNTFGGRKFFLTVVLLLAVVVCTLTGTAVDSELLSLVKWVCGLYFAGNVAQKNLAPNLETRKRARRPVDDLEE
jgi:hypothetical protein